MAWTPSRQDHALHVVQKRPVFLARFMAAKVIRSYVGGQLVFDAKA
jgi:hypothetical protein